MAEATGVDPPELHVVGGGARNESLCQWTADATGLPVLAGPEEATLIGNLLVQAMALGELASLAEARDVVRASFEPTSTSLGVCGLGRGSGAFRGDRCGCAPTGEVGA